jgi:uncharacterized membrane protein YfcA
MIAGLDASELVKLALMLVAVGALSGFFAGIFGIGGGAILVPVFYECFRLAGVPLGVRMPLCIGTSLAIIIPTSISSFRAHYLRGAVNVEVIKRWWLPIVLGVAAGSVTARFAPERLFKIVFVMVAWSAAARLLLARDAWKFGDELPKGFLMRLYGFFVGLLSTLMGIGGGLFANLLMTFYGRPIHQAVATSSALAPDLDPRRTRLRLCRLAGGGAFSRCRCAAAPVCDRLCLADRRGTGDADDPGHRAARGESRACDVEAGAGDGVWKLPAHRRRPVCNQFAQRAVKGSTRTRSIFRRTKIATPYFE